MLDPQSDDAETIDEPSKVDSPLLGRGTPAPEFPAGLYRIILYISTIHFLLGFCQIVQVAPLIRLFEDSLCRTYFDFPTGGLNEALCKIPEVQVPLAKIRGWKALFDTLPVLIVAIPFGRLGDKYGQRKVMALAVVGAIAAILETLVICKLSERFSLPWVYLSSAFLVLGGGLNSASAYMWAMASEMIPSDYRSHAFYHVFAAFYIAELVASFTAALTTDYSPWIPVGLALLSAIILLLIVTITPVPKLQDELAGRQRHASASARSPTRPESDQLQVKEIYGIRSAFSNRNMILTIPVFFVGILRYNTLNVLIQYASVRFGMSLSSGSTFYTETALVNIFLFLLIVPRATTYLIKRNHVRPMMIDLFLVRFSVASMCMGALLIGLAQTKYLLPIAVLIFSAGFGSRVAALSLVSFWITSDSKAAVYAAIVVLESVGHSIGDPALLQILANSLSFPLFWQATPFFVASGFYFIAVLSSSFIRVPSISSEQDLEPPS